MEVNLKGYYKKGLLGKILGRGRGFGVRDGMSD